MKTNKALTFAVYISGFGITAQYLTQRNIYKKGTFICGQSSVSGYLIPFNLSVCPNTTEYIVFHGHRQHVSLEESDFDWVCLGC